MKGERAVVYHFTTKGAFTDRCTHVHQHDRRSEEQKKEEERKKARALYIMIRHFGITTKRTWPRHALRGEEFYIWNTSAARKEGNPLARAAVSLPLVPPSLAVAFSWRIDGRTC